MNCYDVILKPVISEKTTAQNAEKNQVSFRVNRYADKSDIKAAVEKIYPKLTVLSVNTSNVRGKLKQVRRSRGLTASWKKAIVTLKSGSKLEFQ
jgi:large subunit ribosomal protein L23